MRASWMPAGVLIVYTFANDFSVRSMALDLFVWEAVASVRRVYVLKEKSMCSMRKYGLAFSPFNTEERPATVMALLQPVPLILQLNVHHWCMFSYI